MITTRRNARIGFESEVAAMPFKEPKGKTLPSLADASGGDPPRRPNKTREGDTGHYAPDISPTFKPLPIRLSPPPFQRQPIVPPRKPGPIVILGGDAFDSGGTTPAPSAPLIPKGPTLMLGGEALEPPSPRPVRFGPLPAPPQRPVVMLGGEAFDAPPSLKRAHTI